MYRLNSATDRLEKQIGQPSAKSFGSMFALVAQDTKSLFLNSQTRGEARALICAVLVGAGLGVAVGGAYFTGSAAAQAANPDARVARLSRAAAAGFTDQALRSETDEMSPGVLAAARRHDPLASDANGVETDRRAALAAAAAIAQRKSAAQPFRYVGALESSRDLDCLGAAVYYEARGETAAGQAAVAQVVLNRVRHPAFPKTVCGVVYQGANAGGCQFSFVCDGSMRRSREPAAWNRARAVAARALGGYVMTEVGSAVNFHVARMGSPWGGGMIRVSQVGSHIFYRMGGRAEPIRGGAYVADIGRDAHIARPTVVTGEEERAGEDPTVVRLAVALSPTPIAATKPETSEHDTPAKPEAAKTAANAS